MAEQTSSPVRRSNVSHEQAVELSDIIEFLHEHLGARLLALTVDVDPKTVGRWLTEAGRGTRFETETRIRAAYQVFRVVQTAEAAPTVRAWFMGMNPQLDDKSPAEAIRDGEARDAMAAARAFIRAG